MQMILIASGLLVAAGGVLMLVRGARGPETSPRRAYTPIGMIFLGGLIAYRAFTEFATMDGQDLLITSLFVVALLSLLGLQFFVADKKITPIEPVAPAQDRVARADPEGSVDGHS
ncbi:MAG: hypothetical protein ABIO92_03820 [Chloroflexia bacterium]